MILEDTDPLPPLKPSALSPQTLKRHDRSFISSNNDSIEEVDCDLKPSLSKKTCLDAGPSSSVINPLPTDIKVEKRKEREIPTPFPWPDNFKPDVELALSKGQMSRETKAAFYSTIAHTMFGYRKYPTREEYVRVACEIITRYPFLKPPKGSPTVSYTCTCKSVSNFFVCQASIK